MNSLSSALKLYMDCGRKTVRALGRSLPAVGALALYSVIIVALSSLVAPLGLVGGFAVGLFHAGCAGSYLYLIDEVVCRDRSLGFSDLTDSAGPYLWEVISVLFIFWIAELVLQLLGLEGLTLALVLVAFMLFNAVPEVLYQSRALSTEALSSSTRFIRENWPEWFGPQVLLIVVLAPLLNASALHLLRMFGPFFGFLDVTAPLALELFAGRANTILLTWSAFAVITVHSMMLFRGFLYAELSTGSRRTRAWKARF
ncbi:MAG: hypothetical protein VX519_05075 [Myxococcota bacterium]|nr:hypothetical protein [Myxococcota bacterium]